MKQFQLETRNKNGSAILTITLESELHAFLMIKDVVELIKLRRGLDDVDDGGRNGEAFLLHPSACFPFQPAGLRVQSSNEEMTHGSQISGDVSFITRL